MYHFHSGDRTGVLEPVILLSQWGTSCWKQLVQIAIRSQVFSSLYVQKVLLYDQDSVLVAVTNLEDKIGSCCS
jgi:hypothetical protein